MLAGCPPAGNRLAYQAGVGADVPGEVASRAAALRTQVRAWVELPRRRLRHPRRAIRRRKISASSGRLYHEAEVTGVRTGRIRHLWSGMRCSRGSLRCEPELLHEPQIVEASPAFDDLAVDDPEDVDATQHDVLSRRRLTHHRAAVGAMGDEMLHEEIIFGDHVLDVAAPIGKRLAEQLSSLAHAFRPVRRTRQRRVVVDELWIEIPIDGGQVTIGEQGTG